MENKIDNFFVLIDEIQNYFLPNLENKTLLLIIFTLAATLLTLFLIIAIRFIFKKLQTRLITWKGTRIKGVKFGDLELLTEEQITQFFSILIKWISYIPILIVIYLYLNIIFSFFPATRGIATVLLSYFLNAISLVFKNILSFIPNLVLLIIIIYITRIVLKMLRLFFDNIASEKITIKGFDSEWATPTFNIVRFLLIIFALVVAFPYMPGSTSPAFKGVTIFIGVLLSLSSSGSIANVISGLALTYMNAFRIGDRVKIADAVGDVVEKSMLVTRIRTVKNVYITIPNGLILNNHIINYSSKAKESGLILHTNVTIGYDEPWRKIHQLLIDAALNVDSLEKEPAPFVLQKALDDFYVDYEINAYTKNAHQMNAIYSELHQNIQDKFHEAGVEIASPGLSSLREGNKPNIPDEYLPKDFNPAPSLPWPFQPSYKKPSDKD